MLYIHSEIHDDLSLEFTRILNTTATCYRTGYFATESKLEAFLGFSDMQAQDQFRPVYRKGKERVMPSWDGYRIYESDFQLASKFYRCFSLLMASGIYRIWERWYDLTLPTNETIMIQAGRVAQLGSISPQTPPTGPQFTHRISDVLYLRSHLNVRL